MILKNTVFAEIRCFLCGCVERKEKMTYTAKSREELIEQVKEYLKSEELHVKTEDENRGGYSLVYILIRKYSPEKTTVVASNESGGVFMFYPYDEQEDFSEPWDFDADRLLFEMLGEGYPAEIENVLSLDSRVRDVIAYGYSRNDTQEIGLKIFGDFADEQEVLTLCRRVLSAFQIPSQIELLSENDIASSGKKSRK